GRVDDLDVQTFQRGVCAKLLFEELRGRCVAVNSLRARDVRARYPRVERRAAEHDDAQSVRWLLLREVLEVAKAVTVVVKAGQRQIRVVAHEAVGRPGLLVERPEALARPGVDVNLARSL